MPQRSRFKTPEFLVSEQVPLRSILVARVRQATDRRLRIKGSFDADLWLDALVTAEQVMSAGALWRSREEMVRARRLEAASPTWPFRTRQGNVWEKSRMW